MDQEAGVEEGGTEEEIGVWEIQWNHCLWTLGNNNNNKKVKFWLKKIDFLCL